MLGSNVPTRGGISAGFKYADEWGCKSIQIYITPSRRWKVPSLSEAEINDFKSAWENSGVKIVVAHVPFLVNLASKDANLRKKSIGRLATEIDRAIRLGVTYLVLHPGSNPRKNIGKKLIIQGLNKALKGFEFQNTKILLETIAGQGNMIGSKFQELSDILSKVDKTECLGICFDSCHVFAAGYDIRGYQGYRQVIERIDEIIGIEKIRSFHLNDSKADLGSRTDRHASLGEGYVGLQFFHALVRDKRFNMVPKILEIPERDKKSKDNITILKNLRKTSTPIEEPVNFPKQSSLEVFK